MPIDWAKMKKGREKAATLLSRLEAGDDLHREALAEIRRLRAEVREADREGREGARDAYVEGAWQERERQERGGW